MLGGRWLLWLQFVQTCCLFVLLLPAYRRALAQATSEFGAKSSVYRSARIVTLYKRLGGVIGPRPHPRRGLSRWFREQWVQVVPFLENGLAVSCGGRRLGPRAGKACRPLRRVSAATPVTIPELLRLHPRRAIIRAAKAKERLPAARVIWRSLTVCPP